MKIDWRKLVVIGVAICLVFGLFGDSVSAADESKEVEEGGFFFRYRNVPTLADAVKEASNLSLLEGAYRVGPVNRETITKGEYKGVKVLVYKGQLCTYEFVKIPPSYTIHRLTVGKDNKTAMFEDGEVKLKYAKRDVIADPEKMVSNVADDIVSNIMKGLSVILATGQLSVTLFLQWVMVGLDMLLNAGNILKNDGVQQGWTEVRNLCNMFFILILLAIAFMTVFMGVEGSSYSVKRALPMLIIAILMINFSFFICKVIIEGADIASRSFVGEEEAGVLGDIMGVKKMGNISVPSRGEYGEALENIFGVSDDSKQ